MENSLTVLIIIFIGISIFLSVTVVILSDLNPTSISKCYYLPPPSDLELCQGTFNFIVFDNCEGLNGEPLGIPHVNILEADEPVFIDNVQQWNGWHGVCIQVAQAQINTITFFIVVLVIIAAIAILTVVKMF